MMANDKLRIALLGAGGMGQGDVKDAVLVPGVEIAAAADVVLAVGTRLQDFTTGSWALFREPARRIISLNVQTLDATKHLALPLVGDAKVGLVALSTA